MIYTLYQGDCLQELDKTSEKTVDLLLVDLPYGTTKNKWDSVIPFDSLWGKLNKVMKENGNMVFTASQPFTSQLVNSNLDNFRYEIIWEKTIGSGQLNIKRQPLKNHESVLIFYNKPGTYNPQMSKGEPYKISRKMKKLGSQNYNEQTDHISVNEGFRYPKTVIKIPNPRIKGGHPTQKPLALMDYLIKTYSNEGDLVLDCCMGVGTTGISALQNKRNFIGIEKEEKYYQIAEQKIKEIV
jgi:site-specific DNA-methyltransferase (adenine-specific)